jgi:hypothetical protein
MSRTAPLCLLLAAVVGCATTQPEQLATEYRPGGPVRTDPAPQSSVYALYRVADASNQPTRALCAQVRVYQGSPLGFDRGADEKPRAVAGSDSFALAEEGWYRWEAVTNGPQRTLWQVACRPSEWQTGLSDPTREALERSGQVVAFPFMVVGGAILTTFALLFGLPGGA